MWRLFLVAIPRGWVDELPPDDRIPDHPLPENINLFTDIFSKDVDELTDEQERVIDEILHELERPQLRLRFDDSGVDYDEEERKDNLFKVILYKLGWGDIRKRKWILFLPIYGTFIYIMALILDWPWKLP